jgi:Tol biopolymer transport system component
MRSPKIVSRQIISLALALIMGLTGILPQSGASFAAAGQGIKQPLQDAELRQLLTTLSPEALGNKAEENALVTQPLGVLDAADPSAQTAAPVLDPLPAFSSAKSIKVTGSAVEGDSIVLSYSLNNAEPIEEGSVEVDEAGRFSFDVMLASEGVYRMTAVAQRDGETSAPSQAVSVEVDRTPPDSVNNEEWRLLYPSNTTILLQWTSPTVSDGKGGWMDDPSVTGYRIYNRAGDLLKETTERQVIFADLEPATIYSYRIRAVDQIGNESSSVAIVAGTSPANEVKLAEPDSSVLPVLSGDGNTVLYVSDNTLYRMDITTGVSQQFGLTSDGQAPDGAFKELAINRDGSVFAFASDASNLRVAEPSSGALYAIYVYFANSDTLERISSPASKAATPSMDAGGNQVVFSEGSQIYLYDSVSRTKRLVSKAHDGSPGGGVSSSPVISGDGKRIAYETTATDLIGAPVIEQPNRNAVAVYDIAAGQHIWLEDYNGLNRNLRISNDGKYVIFTSNGGSGWAKVYALDMRDDNHANWDTDYFPDNRPTSERKDKAYEATSLSGDGRYMIALARDYNPSEMLYKTLYLERFDRETGEVDLVGNPGFGSNSPQIDETGNRVIYKRNGELYTYCYGVCQQRGSDDAISSADWSVPDNGKTSNSLNPGAALSIQAIGKPNKQVAATIAYHEMIGADPAQIRSVSKTIAMTESPAASGVYRAEFRVAEGMTQIDSIAVGLDGDGDSRLVAGLPVDVAGKLVIDVATDYPDLLSNLARFALQSSNTGSMVKPLAAGQKHYVLYWPATTDLRIRIEDKNGGAVYAERNSLTVNKGGTTALTLTPVLAAALSVKVLYGNTPVAAQVTFKDKNGGVIERIATNEHGEALLKDRSAGEPITVTVSAPVDFVPPGERIVTLGLGSTALDFSLDKWSDAIRVDNVSYSRETGQKLNKLPVIGSEAVVTVKATSGLAIRAKLSKLMWEGGEAQVNKEEWITLTEAKETPGAYTGSFQIVEGTAKLERMTLEVGGMELSTSYSINKNIASQIQIALDVPADSEWSDWSNYGWLELYYPGSEAAYPFHYEKQSLRQGELLYTFNVPYERLDYAFSIIPYNQPVVLQTLTSPAYGQTEKVTIAPQFRFQFLLNVKKGTEPAGRFKAVLRNAVNRAVLWESSGYSGMTAMLALPRRADAPETLELTIIPEDPGYETRTIPVVADARSKALNIELSKKPEALLSGRVLNKQGEPAGFSSLTATVTANGFSKSYSTKTDEKGNYSLKVPKGEVELRATNSSSSVGLSRLHTFMVEDDQQKDLILGELAKVTLKLYTRLGGVNWEGPLDMDWSSEIHFRISKSFTVMKKEGNTYQAWATIGDTVRICADGVEAGLPAQCKEAVIGENNEALIELRLENIGGEAYFRAFRPDGTLLNTVYATLQQSTDHLQSEKLLFVDKEKKLFIAPLQGSGNQRLLLKDAYSSASASIDFTANPEGVINLGDIQLKSPGSFSGQGNGIETASEWTTPNGRITLRAVYSNNLGSELNKARDAVMIIELPQAVELISGTVVLNGKAVQPTKVGRSVEIPIGEIPRRAKGSMQLQLQVQGQPAASQLVVVGKMRYTDSSQHEEVFGTGVMGVVPATLRAPKLVAEPQLSVSGYAPAGSEVTVYDNGVSLGRATATATGTWALSIMLVDLDVRKHRLTTEVNVNGVRSPGEKAVLEYDPNDAGLKSVKMRQQDGRVIEFDTAKGVSVFPYVVVPGYPFVFELKFRDVSRIYDVYVQLGDRTVQAQLVNGQYQAIVPFTYSLGPLGVEYRTKRNTSESPGTAPTEEDYRNDLPLPLTDYEVEWAAGPEERRPDGTVMPAGAASLQVKVNDNLSSQISVFREPVKEYSPSEHDLKLAEKSGVPVYGFSISKKQTESKIQIRISGYVPSGSKESVTGSGERRGIAALAAKEELVKKTIEFTINKSGQALGFRDVIAGTMDAADPDNFMRRINRAIEMAEQICDPQAKEYYLNFAEGVKLDIFVHEQVKLNLGVLGTIFGSGLWGIVFWAEGYYIGQKLDEVANNELTELENHLRAYNNELGCKKKPPREPIADPKFIWDPSGYVYEGIPSNRVQGVTATVMEKDQSTGEWNIWDAEWYGQTNPLTTDGQGRYGWDVPPGKWKVKYEKEDYEVAYSDELDVPPPQLEVNVPVVSYRKPEVESVNAAAGGTYVDITFSKPIDVQSLGDDSVIVALTEGIPIEGLIEAKEPIEANGQSLTMAVRYSPNEPLADGIYNVTVSGALTSYAGVPIGDDAQSRVQVVRQDEVPPAEVSRASVGVAFGIATIVWTDPKDHDYAKAYIRWRKVGDAAYGGPIEIAKGVAWAQITGLPDARGYDFRITTVDDSGNESAGALITTAIAEDLIAPLSVTNLKVASATANQLLLNWTDSLSSDLAKLQISWTEANDPGRVHSGEVLPGVESFAVSGLQPNTEITVSIVAEDRNGNQSAAMSLETTTKPATTNDGGGSSGGTGGNGPTGEGTAGNPNATEIQVGSDGGSFSLFEGLATLTVPQGAFPALTKLKLTLVDIADRKPLPEGYTWMSKAVDIAAEGAAPAKPLLLSLQEDAGETGTMDERRLGIYQGDSSSSAGWRYMGGVVDSKRHRVEASISTYGRYAILLYDHPFTDLAGHWSRANVDVLVSRHIVSGVNSTSFAPNRLITRAEVTKLLVESLRYSGSPAVVEAMESTVSSDFGDVSKDAWYASYIETAFKLGLVAGANQRFRPNDPVTREELVILLQRFARLQGLDLSSSMEGTALDHYIDADEVSKWAKDAMIAAVNLGWVHGVTPTELKPRGQASRAEAASLLLRVLTTIGLITK